MWLVPDGELGDAIGEMASISSNPRMFALAHHFSFASQVACDWGDSSLAGDNYVVGRQFLSGACADRGVALVRQWLVCCYADLGGGE